MWKTGALSEPSKSGAFRSPQKAEPFGALSDWSIPESGAIWSCLWLVEFEYVYVLRADWSNELLCFVMCKHLIGWIQTSVFTESWLVKMSCYVLWCVSIWVVEFRFVCLLRVDWSKQLLCFVMCKHLIGWIQICVFTESWLVKTICYVLWRVSFWLVRLKLLINLVIWLVKRYEVRTESLPSRQLLSGHWRVHMLWKQWRIKVKKDSQPSVCLLLQKAPYSLSLIPTIAKEREKKKRPQYLK